MLLELCSSGLVLVCIVIIIYLLKFSKPFTITKELVGSNLSVTVKANKKISRLELRAKQGKQEISFLRTNLLPGEMIEFCYPASAGNARLILSIKNKDSVICRL